MKFKQKDLKEILNKHSELDIDEIIDSKLNLIGGSETDNYNSTEVTANTTTDTFVDATRQQNGKNRYYGYVYEHNSALVNKKYKVPKEVKDFLKTKLNGSEGSKRVKALLNNPQPSYQQIKRFKHDIENVYNGDWEMVLNWINSVLTTDRDSINSGKKITHDTGMQNRYRTNHEKAKINNPDLINALNESEVNYGDYKKKALRDILKKKIEEKESILKEIKKIKTILNNK